VVVYRHDAPSSVPTATPLIATLTAIGQAAGLAAATGLRPFLPPLVAGVFARAGVGLDFSGTELAFLESTWFLALMLGLTVAWYAAERARPAGPHARALPVLAAILGGLLGGGSFAAAGYPVWIVAIIGVVCSVVGSAAASGLVARAARRLEGAAATMLGVWVDLAAVALAALAIVAWPVGIAALLPLAWLALRGRQAAQRKHEGLRTLR
jgi:hypothetical protein